MLAKKNIINMPSRVIDTCITSFIRPKFSTLPKIVNILINDKNKDVPKSTGSILLNKRNITFKTLPFLQFYGIRLYKTANGIDKHRAVCFMILLILTSPNDHMLSRLATAYALV